MERTELIRKQVSSAFDKTIYLLGEDSDGIKYWLEEPSWDCNWYWGFGYLESYTNNKNPGKSRDIRSHSHIDSMFLDAHTDPYTAFNNFFAKTTLEEHEIWKFLDYMQTFYTLKESAELFSRGYSYFTEKAKMTNLKRQDLNELINKTLLPKLFKNIKNLLSKEEDEDEDEE